MPIPTMRKIFALLPFILFLVIPVNAQRKQIDSLKKLLQTSTTDTSKISLLIVLSRKYYLQKPDSGLSYAAQALSISKRIGSKSGQAHALTQTGFSVWLLGNRPAALKTFLSSLNIATGLNDQWSIARDYDGMSCIYSEEGESKSAIAYAHKAEAIFDGLHDYQNVVDELMDLSDFFGSAGKPDSALFYSKKALALSVKINEFTWRAQILMSMGRAYFAMHNYKLALDDLHKSVNTAIEHHDTFNQIGTDLTLANFYRNLGNRDSSIFHAKRAFDMATSGSFLLQVSETSKLLAQSYYGKNDHEAARYYKISTSITDSLFNAEKARQVFIINITEQQREADIKNAAIAYQNKLKIWGILSALLLVVIILLIVWRNNKKQQIANKLLESQKQQIQTALHQLKSTQTQLIQSEKMASLGELTAGIAHEIQNPLNFVNNFSEVNRELLAEMKGEIDKGDLEEVRAIANDLIQNEEKINHHGKRADFIVKGMLEHSRTNTGEKQLTDMNVLCDEFLKLSYHGLRAKDKSFNAEMVTHFDAKLPKVNVSQQDMGRVMLNLFNNAFYAVNQKLRTAGKDYKPEVTVTTSAENGQVVIKVKDNGVGIPDAIKEKIMQPFFTTKPTGEGTGLGLSLSFDIVVKGHGGMIEVNTKEGEFTEFIVSLPLT